jgi:hypothetical protein
MWSMAGISDALVETIREHEMRAVRVEIDPLSGDVVFKLPDRSGLSVPGPIWVAYCQRVRLVPSVAY